MRFRHGRYLALLLPILLFSLLIPLTADGRSREAIAPINKPISIASLSSQNQDDVAENVANCRYGVTTNNTTQQVNLVDDFGAGWFLDFQYHSPAATNGAEYVPMIYVRQDKDQYGNYLPSVTITPPLTNGGLGQVIDAKPGHIWIIGNEVDRGPDPGKNNGVGDTYADVYARAYHDAYHFIKQRDPSALIGISGLVEVTPGRLNYLDQVWDNYQAIYKSRMPVDVWTMHLYILPEVTPGGEPNNIANVALGTDPALGIKESAGYSSVNCPLDDVYCVSEHDSIEAFSEQVVAMRTWMRDHGERQKPLILTEYSILYPYFGEGGEPCGFKDEDGNCFSRQRVADFMGESFNYMENAIDPNLGYSIDGNRLMQQWLWFSVHRPNLGYASNLINDEVPAQFTLAGQRFQDTTFASTLYVNLIPGNVSNPVIGLTGDSVTANLTVAVHNNGTIRAQSPFEVSFYSDSGLHQLIGTAIVPGPSSNFPGMTGCATRYITASVDWPGLQEGDYPFWVKIDPLGAVDESNEDDNVAVGLVRVLPGGVFLPLIMR